MVGVNEVQIFQVLPSIEFLTPFLRSTLATEIEETQQYSGTYYLSPEIKSDLFFFRLSQSHMNRQPAHSQRHYFLILNDKNQFYHALEGR